MTNLEALKAAVQYPLENNSYLLALLNRELTTTESYSASNLKKLELAKADCLCTIISTPNIVEGGYQLSHSDKKVLSDESNRLYKKWGESANVSKVTITDTTEQW